MMRFKQIPFKALAVFAFILIFIGQKTTQYERWDNIEHVINHDMKGYYAYLPAFFIQKDITLTEHRDFSVLKYIWAKEYKDKKVIKYSSGLAILHTPAFLIAHAVARADSSVEANGYSAPYALGVSITAFLFLFLALLYAYKLLTLFFTENTALIALLGLFLGTNIFHYTYFNVNTSHVYSVALIFIFLYYGIMWLKKPTYKNSFFLGLAFALIVLIRPVDIMFLPLPFLLSMNKSTPLKQLLLLCFSNYKKVLFAFCIGVIVFIPQLLYNYTISGQFIFYTYTDEGFFFTNPQIFNLLFSFRNGWILYSPILILGFIGLFLLFKQDKLKWSLYFLVLFLYIYVISSWWCWWYAGFGNRACINLLPVMSIPFAYCIHRVLTKKWFTQLLTGSLLAFLILFNWFQADKYTYGSIHYSSMSAEAYWNSWDVIGPRQLFEINLRPLNIDSAIQGVYISNPPTFDTVFEMKSLLSNQDQISYLNGDEFGFQKKIPVKNIDRIYIQAESTHPVFLAARGDSAHALYSESNEIKQEKNGVFTLHNWIHLTSYHYEGDSLEVFIWNKDKRKLTVSGLNILGLKSKDP